MAIAFADEIGSIIVTVDENGIQFADGIAYFSGLDGKDYMIPVEDIRAIAQK